MDVGQWIAIGVAVFVWLWYVIGYFLNRKRAGELFDWVISGLDQLGDQVDVGRVGRFGSTVRIHIEKAAAPYRWVEIFLSIEPRENLPIWIYNLIRGKRDEIFIKANLRNAPGQELEVARRTDRGFRRYVAGQQKKPFELVPGPHEFEIARRGKKEERGLEHMRLFLDQYGKGIVLVSVQQKEPHVNIRAFLSSLKKSSASDFYASMIRLFS